MSENEATWSLYIDTARMLVDLVNEGPNPQGAVGTNWQPGYTYGAAMRTMAALLKGGWTRGSETSPRY